MSNRTEDASYCANELCENVAEYRIPRSKMPLCGVCAVAWTMGKDNTQDDTLTVLDQPKEVATP